MRAKTLRMAVLAIALFLLTSCAAVADVGNEPDAGDDAPLRIAFGTDITTLNPWMTKSVQTDMSVISQIYETLTLRGPDLKIRPALAEKWEHPEPDKWVFTLRDDVTFANGDPFDSSVVKWNIEQVKDPTTKARIAPNMAIVESVETPDPRTVEITTTTPDTTIPALMSYFFFVSPDWAEAGHNLAEEPMGTGPYELVAWDHNSMVTLKARDDYWGEPVAFQTVEYHIIPDPAAQIAALQTDAVDIITSVNPDQMPQVQQIPGVKAGAVETIRSAFLMMNTVEDGPLADRRVRQALNHAIDKKTIVASLFHGLTAPSPGQPVTKDYTGFNDSLSAYPYDPDKARTLLAEAGYGDGFTITLTYPSSTYLLADKTTQVVKEQLAEIGVTVEVQAEPFSSWLSNMYGGKISDITYLTYAWPTLDGVDLLRNFAPGGAQSFWTNQDYATALEQAQATADPEEHAAGIREALAVMREEAPFVFLFPQPLTYAYRDTVVWTPRPDDWVRATEMSRA